MKNDLSVYLKVRDEIGTGDLIEWHSKSIIGWAIRMITRNDVNHSSLALKLDYFEGLKDRRFVLEALEHGITLNLLSRRLEKFNGKVYWYKLKAENEGKRGMIASWALEQVGKKYDYKSLFLQLLFRVSANARKFFCSEYAYMAYRAAGMLIGMVSKAPRPGEFMKFGLHEKERVQLL